MKIRWSASAKLNLDQIYASIAKDNARSAADIEDRIFEAAESLRPIPQKGRSGRLDGTREWIVSRTSYLIIYEAIEDYISILRIVHGHQLWPPEAPANP